MASNVTNQSRDVVCARFGCDCPHPRHPLL